MYKIFTGSTLKEALQRARLEYGDYFELVDQVRKQQRKGLWGLFGKEEFYEITVSIRDNKPAALSSAPKTVLPNEEVIAKVQRLLRERQRQQEMVKSSVAAHSEEKRIQPETAVDFEPQEEGVPKRRPEVFDELLELKGALEELVSVSKSGTGLHSGPRRENGLLQQVRNFLEAQDFERSFIDRMLDALRGCLTVKQTEDPGALKEKLSELLSEELEISTPLEDDEQPPVAAFVGPTGVGKTTTVAKLGTHLHLRCDLPLQFLTLDNYRIGGSHQLEEYSKIIETGFHAIHQTGELHKVIDRAGGDFLLLDTAGRSQKKDLDIKGTQKYFKSIKRRTEIYLVVSATTKYRDLLEIMEKFEILNYNHVIVTKLDETNTLGSIWSALSEKGKPLAYYCDGQDVAEDFHPADRGALIERVMKRFEFYVDMPVSVSG